MNRFNSNIGLSLFFPITGFILTLFNPKNPNFRVCVLLFFTFVGIVLIPYGGADTVRYVDNFESISQQTLSLQEYYDSCAKSNQIDYYLIGMTWIISRIVSDYHIFLGILAFVTSFFLVENVFYLMNKCEDSKMFKFLVVVLLMIPNVTLVTHRWWTAMNIFIYGLLPFILDGNKKKLFFCFLSVFVHFSFLYMLILLVLQIISPKKILLPYLLLFLSTLMIQSLNLNVISDIILSYLPQDYSDRSIIYLTQTEGFNDNWLFNIVNESWKWLSAVLAIKIYYIHKHKGINEGVKNLYIMSLFVASFAQIAALTDWGWRFLDASNFLITGTWLLICCKNRNFWGNSFEKLCMPFFSLSIVVFIRHLTTIVGFYNILFGNYVTTWFLDDKIPFLLFFKM